MDKTGNAAGDRLNTVSVRLTREEYKAISQDAARSHMTISEYLRSQAMQDSASSLDQLRIEVRQQEEILEHIIFMLEMVQQTSMGIFSEIMHKLMRIDGDVQVGESAQEFMKRAEAESSKLMQRILARAVNREVDLHITGDWDTKDPLCLGQYEKKVAEYLRRDEERRS